MFFDSVIWWVYDIINIEGFEVILMYDMDLYREFNKIEYDETKRSVYYYLKTGMSLEVLYDFNIIKKMNYKKITKFIFEI